MYSRITDVFVYFRNMTENEILEEIIEEVVRLHHSVDTLEELLKIQCSNGNWDYDPYMHGMANGMLLAMSLFKDKNPRYLDPPKQWGCDIPTPDKSIVAET